MLPWIDAGLEREEWLVQQITNRIGDPKRLRVVEFGSATGEITRELLSRGFDVTAIEARQSSHAKAYGIAPGARQILADVECIHSTEVGGPFDVVVHVGVLYHLLGPIEHLMQLHRWGPRLLLDTHYCDGNTPELHKEQYTKPRAGLRPGSWWLPQTSIEHWLRLTYRRLEKISDRMERNGKRVTYWAEGRNG